MNQKPPRGETCLDHVAHFVPDLRAAGRALEQLGLVVTPESAHRTQHGPAGTSNRCLVLDQGYVEIMAPTMDTPNARRVRKRMETFVGVHLCCFGTPDPRAEHARLAAHGFAPEPLVDLERNLADGTPVRFTVIRLPPAKMPEGRIQYVEHLTPQALWRDGELNALRLGAAYVVAADPAATAARWARFTGALPRRDGKLVELRLARGRIVIGTRTVLKRMLGAAPPAPALAGYELECSRPAAFLARCKAAGFPVSGKAVRLPASLGGVWVIG